MQYLTFEEKILRKLLGQSMGVKEQEKLKFGFYIMSDTIKKGLLVYGISIILGVFWEALITHCSFLFLRQVTYGWHSSTNKGCIIESILLFSIIPYIMSKITIPSIVIYFSGFLLFSVIYFLGPVGTQINILKKEKQEKLKLKLLIRLCLLVIIAIFIPTEVFQYILLGTTIQFITLLIQYIKNGVV